MPLDLSALRRIIADENRLLTGADIPAEYQSDVLGRVHGSAEALAFPLSTEEVSALLRSLALQNGALDFGLKTDEAIYKDSVLDVEEYWNLIAARTADIEDPDTAAIYEKVVEAFQSSATEDVFNNTFGGYFIAVGWDQDLINQ